jgi:hypothetical protein
MLRKPIFAMFCILCLGPAWSASADLVGWWTFDETSGNIAADSSGQGNNGAIVGNPQWVPGKFGGALQFNGSTYVNCGNSQAFNITNAVTLAAWVQPDPDFAYPDWSGIIMRGGANIDTFALYYNGTTKQLGFKTTGTTPNWFASAASSATAMFDREWHHVAATYDGAMKIIYLDGAPLANVAATGRIETSSGRLLLGAGRDLTPATHYAAGKLDDAVIYDQALTEAEIRRVMEGLADKSLARDPTPKDGAVDVPSDAVLGWAPGEYAATHDVYMGTSFVDVNNASRTQPAGLLAAQGQTATEFQPASLEYGQVYFWRIDEVNAAPDNTVFKGKIWSFTVEPYSYPIQNVTATASGSSRADTGPQNTVNGSGLNAGDQHSVELTDMWLSNETSPKWIQYEFDQVYKLDELWVWNANQVLEGFVVFGAKDVAIEYSLDGQAWTTLEGVPEFARAGGMPTYTANTVVDFGGVDARYVRLAIHSNWGGMAKQVSLSEVRFFYVPLEAHEPVPADGAADVSLDARLSWRVGREATSHQVFFGTDSAAVAAETVAGTTLTSRSYSPASMTFGTRYFWKVNEVGDTGTYGGGVWSFTTQEFATIEDFEGYADDEGSRIYEAWIDGMTDGLSGSMVGYMQAPFAEQTIVHSGRQSMPLTYDNSKAPFFSEASKEFDSAQNWTGSGATDLCVWTRGYPAPAAVAVTETAGKMSLTGAGADIWNNSDEFTYAYKTLTGDGALVARVASNGTGTNTWAKGGVMIRDSVNGGSMHAFMAITGSGGNGASFQYRGATNGASSNSDSSAVVAPPYWAKIERSGDIFTGHTSADGKTWSQVGTTVIAMADPVLIGIAVTSHVAGVDRTFQFESIAATGNVTGAWQGAVINTARYNDPAAMYLTVADSAGKSATATSDTAATAADWTRWTIPMSSFNGVSFSKVKRLTIGVGTKGGSTAGGSGVVFIDDIGYGRSAQ